ncbi:MAG: N-6 DNA methylase, partial [Elusimicrobiota bacterium]|nr:N-6 DNA methylase [Elusimicrobiota bacterium]
MKNLLVENEKAIKTTIEILDSYNNLYKKLSKNRVKTYLDYFAKENSDEETLIRPTLFPEFLEKILGFSKNDFIPESSDIVSGKRPDFIPIDTNLHSFVFDTKGTDTTDLKKHYQQIKGYIESNNLEYGILCNMRDLAVFSLNDKESVQELSFSFYQLYLDYQKNRISQDKILVKPNTKRFLSFVEKFRFQQIDKNLKIKLISEKKQWTGKETIDTEHLISKIRNVVSLLHDDVHNQENEIPQLVTNNERKKSIVNEIDSILEEIGKKEKDIINQLEEIIQDKNDNLVQAKDIYFYRTAYFAMTRILLVRAWEDIKFIDESLYNGGFKKWYANFNKEITKVLKNAFNLAANKYSWLYNTENNYTWYEPTDNILIDVLYEFSQFNFSKLSTDVLGTVYEEYVDRTDRKNKGQYYTPPEIISFIWDRVGFTNDKAFFRMEGNKRQPRLIFDPATGSGGFLVEAARRLREEAKYDRESFADLQEIEKAIISGLYGSEISTFAHYITEVNLLLQLTHIIKGLIDAHSKTHPFRPAIHSLSVIRQDSLKLHNVEQQIMNIADFEGKKLYQYGQYERDTKYDNIALDESKREKFDFIRDNSDFDYVCANPP